MSLNLARAEGPRAESAKLLWVSRISPLATVALLLVYIWRAARKLTRRS